MPARLSACLKAKWRNGAHGTDRACLQLDQETGFCLNWQLATGFCRPDGDSYRRPAAAERLPGYDHCCPELVKSAHGEKLQQLMAMLCRGSRHSMLLKLLGPQRASRIMPILLFSSALAPPFTMSAAQRSVWGAAPAAACCPPACVAASASQRRLQPPQRGSAVGGSGCGPAALRGALLVAGAATGFVAPGHQSEWERYQAENDFATRAIGVSSIIRQLARTFRQEWETYRAEWQAQARLVEPKPTVGGAVADPVAAPLDPDYCPGAQGEGWLGEQDRSCQHPLAPSPPMHANFQAPPPNP